MQVRANGIAIEVEEFGEGEPILLVMGLGAQLVYWHPDLCRGLVARGFRVIRFDNRDIGLSEKVDAGGRPNVFGVAACAALGLPTPAPYTLEDMADDIAGLLDALGLESAHLVGASMGGMIAQTVAIRHPGRVRSLASLISSPGGLRYSPRLRALRAVLGRPPPDPEAIVEWSVELFRTIGSPGFPFPEEAIRERSRLAYERCYHPPGVARQMAAIIASGSRMRALARLEVPTLVVHGTEDPMVPFRAGQDMARCIPGAVFLPIEGMGHDMPREVWPQLIEAIVANAARYSRKSASTSADAAGSITCSVKAPSGPETPAGP